MKIVILGLGTVGTSVVKYLQENSSKIQHEIVGVSARDQYKQRGIKISSYRWFEDPIQMIQDASPDVLIEIAGGVNGTAYETVKFALSKGIHVVTANKAMLAYHAKELANIAEENQVQILYEAAIAGAIPITQYLRSQTPMIASDITGISGVLNGTSNYILSRMGNEKKSFDSALKDAQNKGYAETDPSFDIDGDDVLHKIVLLSTICYKKFVNPDNIYKKGIRDITPNDIANLKLFGYSPYLMGVSEFVDGKVNLAVDLFVTANPVVRATHNANNIVYLHGSQFGDMHFAGLGAGGKETAYSVISDLVILSQNIKESTLSHYKYSFGFDSLKEDIQEEIPHCHTSDAVCIVKIRNNIFRDQEHTIRLINQKIQHFFLNEENQNLKVAGLLLHPHNDYNIGMYRIENIKPSQIASITRTFNDEFHLDVKYFPIFS